MAGFLQSAMDLFRPQGGATITPANIPGSNPPANTPPTKVADQGVSLPSSNTTNPLVPADSQTVEVNPLDAFKDIWTPVQTNANSPKPATIENLFANLDVAKLQQQAQTVDFSKSITPEILTRINAGGEDAMVAMVEAMNKVGQEAYAKSALASIQITQQAFNKAQTINNDNLPALIKRMSAGEELAKNPVFNHPTMQPVVGALKESFLMKNPNATTDEINQQVTAALQAMGTALNPPKVDTSKGTSREEDWSTFFST